MYEKLDDNKLAIINKAKEITWEKYDTDGNYFKIDDYIYIIENLLIEIDHLNNELWNIKQDIANNYKRIPIEEQIGYNEKEYYEE